MICAFEDCDKKLRSDNRLGYCRNHASKSLQNIERLAKNYQDNKEYYSELNRQWREDNADRKKEMDRTYHEANREVGIARAIEWNRTNPERRRVISSQSASTRRARKAGLFVERVYRPKVWARDNGVCHICLEPADPERWDLDHIVPISVGGIHAYVNTAVSHPSCNYQKHVRIESMNIEMLTNAIQACKEWEAG